MRGSPTGSRAFALAPALTLALFLGPVLAGLAGTFLPAFGWLPALGGEVPSLEPWRRLLAAPELPSAVGLTLFTGLLSTALALLAAALVLAGLHARPALRLLRPCLLPLLAVPHLSVAIGLAFLLAPSGWPSRLVAAGLGWTRPADLATVNDPMGLALALGLAVKETPFFLLAMLAAAGQVDAPRQLRLARSLGYGPGEAWLKVLLPQLYPQLRLPIVAVLAYALSVVDMAMVLGPASPPPLAPLLWRWFNAPDLAMRFPAAAGSVLLLLLLAIAIGIWRLVELAAARGLLRALLAGPRPRLEPWLRHAGVAAATVTVGLGLASLLALLAWSVAGRWPFPDVVPESWTLSTLAHALPVLGRPLGSTLLLAIVTAAVALVLVVLCIEREALAGPRPTSRVLMLAYLPLLVPQIAFLFGLTVLLTRLGLDGTVVGVAVAHLVFVLPYTLLMLRDPWLALDSRYGRTARALGKPPLTVLLRVKLPLLLRPVLLAAAIAVSVSVAQYLPTLFAGGGRVATLATETLALATGGDRRRAAVAGLLMALVPLAALALAVGIPAWRARGHAGLRQ